MIVNHTFLHRSLIVKGQQNGVSDHIYYWKGLSSRFAPQPRTPIHHGSPLTEDTVKRWARTRAFWSLCLSTRCPASHHPTMKTSSKLWQTPTYGTTAGGKSHWSPHSKAAAQLHRLNQTKIEQTVWISQSRFLTKLKKPSKLPCQWFQNWSANEHVLWRTCE